MTLRATCIEAEQAADEASVRAKVDRVLGAWVSGGSERRRRWATGTMASRAREFRLGLEALGLDGVLPDAEHAVRAELCTTGAAGQYLAKMGCELTGITSKSAHPGHYTHWQIAQQAAAGELWAKVLWQEHSKAMMGARQLTWSRGLRERLGLCPERPDETLAAETLPEPGSEDTPIAELDGPLWDLFARDRHQRWVAELHEAYADGSLHQTLWGESVPAHREPPPKPAWWNDRELMHAHRKGAQLFRGMRPPSERKRKRVSREEREEYLEELMHHLHEDLRLYDSVSPADDCPF
jgi:hypothetical protein